MKIAHIINPVKVNKSSDLFIAQPITFETMRNAKKFAEEFNIDVSLFYTCYEEDLEICPKSFSCAGLLKQSILDIKKFNKSRKLPLIKEILDNLYKSTNADYFVYTNVDIALMPHFYLNIYKMIAEGIDGIIINRRTISKSYTSINEIPQMYSEIGEIHPGYDCFIFSRNSYKNFILEDSCIGANWIGRVLISNVNAFSEKFRIFKNEHLTFHIGDDRSWKINDYNDYDLHNEKTLVSILNQLPLKNEFLKDFLKTHMIRINKTSHNLKNLNEKFDNLTKENYLNNFCFLVGSPRSGTTLTQSLIATQKNVISLPETHFFNWIHPQLEIKDNSILNLQNIIPKIRERIRFSIEAEEYLLNKIKSNTQISSKLLFKTIVFDNLIGNYALNKIETSLILEKTPDHILFIENIKELFPNSKYIFLLRDPEDVILSRRKNFPLEKSWEIKKHIDLWLKSLDIAENENSKNLLIIKYEDIIQDTSKNINKICTFLNIKFKEQYLNQFNTVSKSLINHWESWKNDVKNNSITKREDKEKLNKEDLKTLSSILKDKLLFYYNENK